MDIFTMDRFLLYRSPQGGEHSGRIRVNSMGIHEVMQPGVLSYPQKAACLLMYFHTPAVAGNRENCAGCFIAWTHGSICRYGNSSAPWDHSWCVLEGDAVSLSLKLHNLPLNRAIEADVQGIWSHHFSAIMNELTSHVEQDEYVLEHEFDLLIYELSRSIRSPELRIPDRLRKAEEYMWKNLATPLTLTEIAESVALSVSRFSSLFQQHYGESPMQYLNRKRMNLAAQFLAYHTDSCKQVAERTGFADQFHFSRRFRQFWGVSPQKFREKQSPLTQCAIGSKDNV